MNIEFVEELSKFKNSDLKKICSNNKITIYGKKLELVNRIINALDRKSLINEIIIIKNKFNNITLDNYINKDIHKYPKSNLIILLKKLNLEYNNLSKSNLIINIENYFKNKYEKPIIFLQNYYKYYIFKKINKLRGPALNNRKLCNNATDFFNLCNIEDIPNKYFYSFRDNDNFIYGFEINSIYKMIDYEPINPYNRIKLSNKVINDINYIYKLINISSSISNINISSKTLEQSVIDIFQTMDKLGNYTNISWFLNLNLHKLKSFYKELEDIWQYRLSLTLEQRKQIIHPNGILFTIPLSTIYHMNSKKHLQMICIKIMDKLVSRGINEDCKKQGCYYILMALTIVNPEAANSLPWLANSVIT